MRPDVRAPVDAPASHSKPTTDISTMSEPTPNPLPAPSETTTRRLGVAGIPSPLTRWKDGEPITETRRVIAPRTMEEYQACTENGEVPPSFEESGPHEKIFFRPEEITCGIVTCGGLCPGLNNVIRSLVRILYVAYGVPNILGFRYGFDGLGPDPHAPPLPLTVEGVDDIHRFGGTLLGSCRGTPGVEAVVDSLERQNVSILFTIGGDGTLRGAHAIAEEIEKRGLSISIVGIPKTIDNDLQWVDRSFGFTTAVEEASLAVVGAHEEARGAWNGIGLVKLMGRHSGFIASHAALANQEANFCLIPEVPFDLDGPRGFLEALRRRLERKHHAVIIVAEGAGQDLLSTSGTDEATDASGNAKLKDIGPFLADAIRSHLREAGMEHTLKYIDPSYIVRSLPAGTLDSALCSAFAHHAVHAGMAGKTDLYIGTHNHRFIDVPIPLGVNTRKRILPTSDGWRRTLEATGQPTRMKN